MLLGSNPDGVNVWSAVRSALVSWYSEMEGGDEREGERWREKEKYSHIDQSEYAHDSLTVVNCVIFCLCQFG